LEASTLKHGDAQCPIKRARPGKCSITVCGRRILELLDVAENLQRFASYIEETGSCV